MKAKKNAPPLAKKAARKKKSSNGGFHNIYIICFEKYLPGLSPEEVSEAIPEEFEGRVLLTERNRGLGFVVYQASHFVNDHQRIANCGPNEVMSLISGTSLCGIDIICWLISNGIHPQELPVLSELEEATLIESLRMMALANGYTIA